jgi:hypothetical protein
MSINKCLVCNEHFTITRARDRFKVFCGRKCVGIYYAKDKKIIKKKIQCPCCNQTFVPRNKKTKYCSRKCVVISNNKNRNNDKPVLYTTCQRCNTLFIKPIPSIISRGDGLYCSRECSTRKYEFDETFFENIDTPEKAYWLGMLYADGNIYKNQMTIKLHKNDVEHLYKLKHCISSKHPIHEGEHTYNFIIGSKKLTQQLKNQGLVYNKSLIVEYPYLMLHELHRHFIRGVFDGDGCIHITKKGNKIWSIFSGSEIFMDGIVSILQMSGFNVKKHKQKMKKGTGYIVRICNRAGIEKMKNYLYDDSISYLQRKLDKFLL